MATNGIVFDGLDELRKFYVEVPELVTAKGEEIVRAAAQETARRATNAYPSEGENTGNLKNGVKVTQPNTVGHAPRAKVSNKAPHAHLYEEGTAVRATKSGANRGSMPARPVIRRIAPQVRRDMEQKLIAMIEHETGAKIIRG